MIGIQGERGEPVIVVLRFARGRRDVVREHIHAARLEQRAPVAHAGAAFDERRMGGEHIQGARVRHAPREKGGQLAPPFFQVELGPELARRGQQHRHQLKAGVLARRELRRERLGLQALAVLPEDYCCLHYQRRVSSTPAS